MEVKGEILLPLKTATVGHFYEDKNDVPMQMLFFHVFHLHIRNALCYFHLFAPDLD